MELGALLCTPTSPKCPGCPITEQCEALRLVKLGVIGSVTAFPEKKVKKAPREETVTVCVVELHRGGDPKITFRISTCSSSEWEDLRFIKLALQTPII